MLTESMKREAMWAINTVTLLIDCVRGRPLMGGVCLCVARGSDSPRKLTQFRHNVAHTNLAQNTTCSFSNCQINVIILQMTTVIHYSRDTINI